MKYEVKNKTKRAKAVRARGDMVAIKPGKKTTIESNMSEAELDKFKAAGLEFKELGSETENKAEKGNTPGSQTATTGAQEATKGATKAGGGQAPTSGAKANG